MSRSQRTAVTAVVAVLTSALAATLALSPGLAGAAPKPTPHAGPSGSGSPSSSHTSAAPQPDPAAVAAAQDASRRAAQRVAGLVHGVAAAQKQVRASSLAAQQAQARFDAQVITQQAAVATADLAAARARAAQTAYATEHQNFVALVTAAYESGDNGTGTITAFADLMAAGKPGDVLAADQDRRLLAGREAQIVAQDRIAALANAAAQARAEAALAAVRQATVRLQALRDSSRAAATKAGAALDVLRRELTTAQVTQAQADAVLSGFLGGWSVSDPARAAALDRHYQQLAAKLGVKTPAQDAVRRALLQIGLPYAWAGGNATGPTTGVCAGGSAANDCHVVGFDCSGLALYAWAPYVSLPHLASTQYSVAGRVHPAVTALLPGDLVFWSSDGTVAGIHHVALYIGDGNVVQAPQSGDIVRVTPLGSVDSGYFGATRPMS